MIELMLLGQAGVLLHYLKEWVKANNSSKKFEWTKALPMILLSSLTTTLAVYLKDSFVEIYPITKFSAVVLGYVGNSAFFSFIEAKKPKAKTT